MVSPQPAKGEETMIDSRYQQLRKVVTASGVWKGERRNTHRFVLSPSAFTLTRDQEQMLIRLATALDTVLAGVGRIAAVAMDNSLGRGRTWSTIARALSAYAPKSYRDIQVLRPSQTPFVCKVDFMIDQTGALKIAEIDSTNQHGLGYSTLAHTMCHTIAPDAPMLPGVAELLAREVKRRNRDSLTLLYANYERFYMPDFEMIETALATHGIALHVLRDIEATVNDGVLNHDGVPCPTLLLNCQPLVNKEVQHAIAIAYKNKAIDFLIPPKPFFGSKGLLALLCNADGSSELEAILHSQIDPDALSIVRSCIPTTRFTDRTYKGANGVLKRVISSGMKGVWFPDDDEYRTELDRIKNGSVTHVMQELVPSKRFTLDHFDDEGIRATSDNWHVRMIVHFIGREVADGVVTACRDQKVHGSKQALFLGVVKQED